MKTTIKSILISLTLTCSLQSITSAQCYVDPHPYAIEDMNAVCSTLSVPYIYIYQCATVENAMATTYGYQPIVLYNPWFFEDVFLRYGRGACISIIAHEVGHHVNFFKYCRFSDANSWSEELRSDFISGIVMRRLGYSMHDAHIYFEMTQPAGSASHPNWQTRVNTINLGWQNAYGF